MSVLKNIWRPEDPPRKGSGPHADSVLTERLAELLGRELEEMQEAESAEQAEQHAEQHEESATASSVSESTDSPEHTLVESPVQDSAAAEVSEKVPESNSAEEQPNFHEETSNFRSEGQEDSVRQASGEALNQLQASEERIEAKLQSRVQDYAQELEAALTAADRGTGSQKSAEDVGQQFRTEAREWFDDARRELQEQLKTSRNSLETELKNSHAELLAAAQQKIDSIARASLQNNEETSHQEDREQVERWLEEQAEASRQQAETGTQELKQATEQAMARLHAVEERIEAGFRNQVEEYRRAVESAAADLEKKGISQANFQHASEELQRLTEQALDRSNRRIEERTEQSITRLSDRLSAAEQSLGSAARAAMEGALLEQQRRLSEAWQEKSLAAVQAVAQAGREGQAQLDAARKAAEEEFRNAAKEQGRRMMEEATRELRDSQFQQKLIQDAAGQMEQAARDVAERSAAEVNKRSESAVSGLSDRLQHTADKFLSDVQQRLSEAGDAWFDSAGQSVQKEYQARMAQWLEEQTQATEQRAGEAERAVARLTDQAATRLELVSREAEASLRSRVQEQQQVWLESAMEEARKSGFERKMIDQALADMEKATAQMLDQATKQLNEQAESSRASIGSQMEAASRKLLEGVEASLENISWQHRGRLAQWWEERNQTARREGEMAAASITQASQQATSQLRSLQTEIESEMRSRAREQQTRLLESAIEEMRQNGTIERAVNEASSTLRTNANEVISRSVEQIRDQAESSRLALDNQAQASRRGLAEELAKKMDQAELSVEAAGKAVTEDYRRQLSVWWEERAQSVRRESEEAASTVSRSAKQASEQLQTVRREMETELQSGLQNYRKGLREAAAEELRRQGFQREMLDSISAELDKAARELAERSTRELKKHVDASLSGLDEKMKSARQGFMEDTQKQLSDLTRSSMDMTTTRFHELLTRNVQDLEREQEEWLQRKRESVWMEINQGAGARGSGSNSSEASNRTTRKQAASGGILGRLLMVAAVVALAAALTAVFVRMTPQKTVSMQLRTDPPSGYVTQSSSWGPQERARQLQLAHAYWMLAINDLQHKYAYNTDLPTTPPPDFRVNQSGLRDDAATRMRYWEKFRAIWKSPDAWQKVTQNGGQFNEAIDWLRNKLTQPQTASSSSSSAN